MEKKRFLKTDKDREEFLLWLDFLWAGILRKGKEHLETKQHYYCCLGVGCVVTIPENKLKLVDGLIGCGDPKEQSHAPKWLKIIDDDFQKRTGYSLMDLNDDTNLSHAQIADRLYEAYKDELQ